MSFEDGHIAADAGYQPPSATVLGDVAELTAGPTGGTSETVGGYHEVRMRPRPHADDD